MYMDVLAQRSVGKAFVQMHCMDGIQVFVRHDFG